jgi:hypothetical protein
MSSLVPLRTWWVVKVWRSAWVDAPGIAASVRYLLTMVRMERVPTGFSNFVRKSASSSSIFGRTANHCQCPCYMTQKAREPGVFFL